MLGQGEGYCLVRGRVLSGQGEEYSEAEERVLPDHTEEYAGDVATFLMLSMRVILQDMAHPCCIETSK